MSGEGSSFQWPPNRGFPLLWDLTQTVDLIPTEEEKEGEERLETSSWQVDSNLDGRCTVNVVWVHIFVNYIFVNMMNWTRWELDLSSELSKRKIIHNIKAFCKKSIW